MNQIHIGQRIKKKREENGFSLQDIAEKLAVNRSSVMRWENGETNRIKLPVIEKLAQILKTTPQYLMGYEDNDLAGARMCSPEDACFLPVVTGFSMQDDVVTERNILYYEIAEAVYNDGNYFYMFVAGNSMAPQINDGDKVLVKKQSQLKDGEVGVMLVDGEGMIRIYRQGNGVELHAFNHYYPALRLKKNEAERMQIIGKVVESRKQW
ncbi:MAG: LexA family transcriptional regulator [Clostridia bacterium]|nr:LexA family transcriptional regulator [Clostridia bacterium]